MIKGSRPHGGILPSNLKARKLLKGRSLRSIARETGQSEQAVYKIFRGERTPRLDTASRIAKAMGVSLEELQRALP